MGRYERLAEWLATSGESAVSLTFDDIEKVLGSPLPESARRYPAFWSNRTVALPLARRGFRARPRLREGYVEFIAGTAAARAAAEPPRPPAYEPRSKPDLILIGCVKKKLTGRHRAEDLYCSALFLGRRRYAESLGVPWFILSAKYGLLAPDDEVESYDVALSDLSPNERTEWHRRVLDELDRRVGPLRGKTVEIHAGAPYREHGLRSGLQARGATVVVPLENTSLGRQLAWYRARANAAAESAP